MPISIFEIYEAKINRLALGIFAPASQIRSFHRTTPKPSDWRQLQPDALKRAQREREGGGKNAFPPSPLLFLTHLSAYSQFTSNDSGP